MNLILFQDLMVGMLDAQEDEEMVSNLIQLIRFVYQPLIENLLFFADELPSRQFIYEELLMAIQSLCSSLKVTDNILRNYTSLSEMGQLDVSEMPADPKKRTEFLRQPEFVENAEKLATDWLSIIERVSF
jgi:hypothetical protein